MEFENQNILIVGASSGIGAGVAKKLKNTDANIYCIGRNLPENQQNYFYWDAENPSDDFLDKLPDTLHGLVYCPGTINLKTANRIQLADYQKDLQINFLGLTEIMRLCFGKLKQAGSASIITFSSVAAQLGMPYHTSIAAAKGAVESYSKSLAAELSSLNIRVNCIAPSLTDTNLAKMLLSSLEKREISAKRHPIAKIGKAEDMAEMAVFLLSEKSSWITGQVFHIDGGLSTLKI